MMTGVRYISYLLLLCVGLLVVGCGDEPVPAAWDSERQGDVTLSLKVSIANTYGPQGSRARVDNDNPFEPTDNPYELINTLRVIIVREDNSVEYNRMVNMPDDIGLHTFGDLEFKVSTSLGESVSENNVVTRTEKKRIYLVANETSIPNDYVKEMLENLKAGSYKKVEATPGSGDDADTAVEEYVQGDFFTPETAKEIMIYNEWPQPDETLNKDFAVPMVDNQGAGKSFIPMSEFYDIPVTEYLTAKKNEHKENLFITRNLVKFQFELSDEVMEQESFRVTDITFSSLRQKEYLFPNETEYSPAKYNADGKVNTVDRIITGYKIPGPANDENFMRDYVFKPDNFGYNSTRIGAKPTSYDAVYNPQLYFCESKTLEGEEGNPGHTKFKVSIGVDFFVLDELKDDDGNPVLDDQGKPRYVHQPLHIAFDAKDLILPEMLPRNTIVKVKMKIKNGELNAVATVYPYTAVSLNPEFGFTPPVTDRLTVAPTFDLVLNGPQGDGLLYPNFESSVGNTIEHVYWVSSNPSVVLLGNNVTDSTDQTYVEPSDAIELPYLHRVEGEEETPVPVRLVAQSVGTAIVTAYTQSGLVARCRVTVK